MQIHLNVLSYFLFWTAFYVLRGSQAQSLATASRPAIYSHLTPSFGSVKKVITPSTYESGHPVGAGGPPLCFQVCSFSLFRAKWVVELQCID